MHSRTALALAALCAAVALPGAGAMEYDPCNWDDTQGAKAKGSGATIGLAFWPGGALEDWDYDPDFPERGGFHPCNNRTELAMRGVYYASFRPSVDTMSALHLQGEQLDVVMQSYNYSYFYNNYLNVTNNNGTRTLPSTANVMSVVAYWGHGEGAVRSEPRYIRSNNKTLTTGAGQVGSLFLVLRFNAGNLKFLQWFSLGCGDCGGANAVTCMSVGGELVQFVRGLHNVLQHK